MTCKYHEITIDVCGLCDARSDHWLPDAAPDNQNDGVCIDPEDITCTYYEDEYDEF